MTEQSPRRVIAVSGPDGGGKGYLTEAALKHGNLVEVPMVTTRPPRGASETKVPMDKPDYDALLESGELVGHHENKGHFYAFRASDFHNLTGDAIIELNPRYQREFPKELAQKGIELVGWIGLHGEPEYLAENIKGRAAKDGKEVKEEELEKKLDMADQIMTTLRDLEQEGVVTMFKVGWDNRETMAEEFSQLVKDLLSKEASQN